VSRTDALGRRTEYTYDTMGNVLTATPLTGTAEAVTTTLTYTPTFDQVATMTDGPIESHDELRLPRSGPAARRPAVWRPICRPM